MGIGGRDGDTLACATAGGRLLTTAVGTAGFCPGRTTGGVADNFRAGEIPFAWTVFTSGR